MGQGYSKLLQMPTVRQLPYMAKDRRVQAGAAFVAAWIYWQTKQATKAERSSKLAALKGHTVAAPSPSVLRPSLHIDLCRLRASSRRKRLPPRRPARRRSGE